MAIWSLPTHSESDGKFQGKQFLTILVFTVYSIQVFKVLLFLILFFYNLSQKTITISNGYHIALSCIALREYQLNVNFLYHRFECLYASTCRQVYTYSALAHLHKAVLSCILFCKNKKQVQCIWVQGACKFMHLIFNSQSTTHVDLTAICPYLYKARK